MRRIRVEGLRLVVVAVLAIAFGCALPRPLEAGATCAAKTLRPEAVADAVRLGTRVFEALEQSAAHIALIGRAGADLSAYGLRFSHMGFALRTAPQGRWTVLHLLNRCETASSDLYDEGLITFFLDDPFAYEAVIAVPDPDTQRALLALVRSSRVWRLHQPNYNAIAHPRSRAFQNSNQWVLESLVAALAPDAVQSRSGAHQHPLFRLYEPDRVHIDRLTRIGGGLFKANLTFTDHPLANRIKGEYEVVSARSVLRFMRRADVLEQFQIIDLHNRSKPAREIERERL